MINNLGSNVKPTAIQRSAKSLGIVHHVCSRFEMEAEVSTSKDYHTYPSFKKDFTAILNQLESEEVFMIKDGRKLYSYDHNQPILQSLDWKKVTEYVHKKLLILINMNQLDLYQDLLHSLQLHIGAHKSQHLQGITILDL